MPEVAGPEVAEAGYFGGRMLWRPEVAEAGGRRGQKWWRQEVAEA